MDITANAEQSKEIRILSTALANMAINLCDLSQRGGLERFNTLLTAIKAQVELLERVVEDGEGDNR